MEDPSKVKGKALFLFFSLHKNNTNKILEFGCVKGMN